MPHIITGGQVRTTDSLPSEVECIVPIIVKKFAPLAGGGGREDGERRVWRCIVPDWESREGSIK